MDKLKELYDFYWTIDLMDKYMLRNSTIYLNGDDSEHYCMIDNLNTSILTYNREYPLIKIKLNYLMFNRADRFDISFSKNAVFTTRIGVMSFNCVVRIFSDNFKNKLNKEGLKWTH